VIDHCLGKVKDDDHNDESFDEHDNNDSNDHRDDENYVDDEVYLSCTQEL
jgi:hypothetical protein